jgi:glycosyltransferase involved in cell wall biosynthesis
VRQQRQSDERMPDRRPPSRGRVDASAFPRVLMVSFWYPPATGGLSKQTHLLARMLTEMGMPISVATLWDVGLKTFEYNDDIPVYRLPTLPGPGGYRRRLYPWLFSLAAFLLSHQREYDVFHIHQALYPAAVSVAIARLYGKKTIVKVTGSGATSNMATLQNRRLGRLARRWIAQADCLISLSDEITAELEENRFNPNIIVSMPNGVEVDVFRMATPKPGLAPGRIVLTAGRLAQEKGVDILIRAWPAVVKRVKEAHLIILAEGPEHGKLVDLACQLGVADHVTFAGNVAESQVASYLAASQVFVLPSRGEGMSNALLEAMAAGRACLASDIPANSNLIQPGVNGLLFKSEDHDDLAAHLVTLLENEALRVQLGANALQTVIARCSIEAVARQYIQLYSTLLESRPNQAALSVRA